MLEAGGEEHGRWAAQNELGEYVSPTNLSAEEQVFRKGSNHEKNKYATCSIETKWYKCKR